MNVQDEQTLTDYWNRETSLLNEKIDDAFREAQNHAYGLGLTRGAFSRWIPVDKLMPEADVFVLAFFINEHGKHRRIRAFYAPRFTVTTSVDNDWYEHKPEEASDDEAYLPEGWYEANEYEDINWHVSATVTHWMPLPEPPV